MSVCDVLKGREGRKGKGQIHAGEVLRGIII